MKNLSELQFKVELLTVQHDRSSFDCGEPALNEFLQRQANQLQKRMVSKTYVAVDQKNQIAGFYSLSVTQIQREQSPEQLHQFSTYLPIPAALIGRLATSIQHQGQGVGTYLLAHALTTIKRIAENIGLAVVVVDAKNNDVAEFYKKYGFIPSSTNALRLFLLVQTIK